MSEMTEYIVLGDKQKAGGSSLAEALQDMVDMVYDLDIRAKDNTSTDIRAILENYGVTYE